MTYKTQIKNIDLLRDIVYKIGIIEIDLIKVFNLYGLSFFEIKKKKIKNKQVRDVFKKRLNISKEYNFYQNLNKYLNIRGNLLHGNFIKVIYSEKKDFPKGLESDLSLVFNNNQICKINSFLNDFMVILNDISWDAEQNKNYKQMKTETSPADALINENAKKAFFNTFLFEIELRMLAQKKHGIIFERIFKKRKAVSLSKVFNENIKNILNNDEINQLTEAINFRNLLVHSNFFELQEKLKLKYPELKETVGVFSFNIRDVENSFKDLSKQERKDANTNLNDTFGLSLNFYLYDFGLKYNNTILDAIQLIRKLDQN